MTIEINNGATRNISVHLYRGVSGQSATFDSAGSVWNLGEWNHMAVTFDGSTKTCKTYINGTQVQSSSNAGFAYSSAAPTFTLNIGRYALATPGDYFNGYMDEIRITKGQVRYTTNFTAPTTSLPTQ